MATPPKPKPKLGLQASNAGRWTKCTASPGMILRNADKYVDRSSFAADEGTEAHLHAACSLLLGYDKRDFGKNKEMARFVSEYHDFVRDNTVFEDQLLVEQEVPLFYMPGRRAFIDVCIVKPTGFTVIDLKYGKGVSVQAEENKQILIYGRSMHDVLVKRGRKFKTKDVINLIIYQPRVYGEEAVRATYMTVGEMLERSRHIHDIAEAIQTSPHEGDHIKFDPSDSVCQFCPMAENALCPAYTAWILGDLPVDLVDLLDAPKRGVCVPVPELMTVEQVASVLRSRAAIMKFFGQAENLIFRTLRSGIPVPDWKLVAAKTTRSWVDEETVPDLLEEYLPGQVLVPQDPKLITPAQAEASLKAHGIKKSDPLWAEFKSMVNKPKGGPVLAPESDKRKPFEDDASQDFDVLGDEDPT